MVFDLYNLVFYARNNDVVSTELLIETFNPQLKKYARLLNGEDTYQSLTVFLLELLHKIPLEKDCFRNDKILFSYISKSLKNKYIKLSVHHNRILASEIEIAPDFKLTDPHSFERTLDLFDLFKNLNSYEAGVLLLIYFSGYTTREVADSMQITRQAVNQIKKRALKKLKRLYV